MEIIQQAEILFKIVGLAVLITLLLWIIHYIAMEIFGAAYGGAWDEGPRKMMSVSFTVSFLGILLILTIVAIAVFPS